MPYNPLPERLLKEMRNEVMVNVKKVRDVIDLCIKDKTPNIKVSSIPSLVFIGKEGFLRDVVPIYGDSVKWSVIDGEDYLTFQ